MPQTRMTRYYRKRKAGTAAAARKRIRRNFVSRTRQLIPGVHHFRRMAAATAIAVGQIGNTTYGAFGYTLTQLPNVSEFTNLYDHFRINMVITKFYLNIDPSATSTQSNAIIPRITWAKDYNDSTAPVAITDLKQYSNVRSKALSPYRPVSVKTRPAVLAQMYESAVATAYQPRWKVWVDTADTSTPHFGLKWAIEQLPTGYSVTAEHVFYFSMKNVR